MEQQTKIIVAVAVIVAAVLVVSAYVFLNSAFTPLDQREDKTSKAAAKNVEIQATTFNGDIQIQNSTNNEIEVTYNVEAPKGHLNEIVTATTNQTEDQNSFILVAEAKLVNSNQGLTVNYRANIIIKLPNTSQYNLTLHTLNGNIVKPQVNDIIVVANTDNGYIDIKDSNCTSINASSKNGNVKVGLAQGTLFSVDANTANGNVSYQGIAMNTSVQTATHLSGSTSAGSGSTNMRLSTANGNITIAYFSN